MKYVEADIKGKLGEIVAAKRTEISDFKGTLIPEGGRLLNSESVGEREFEKALIESGVSLIAEVKKASPSEGAIADVDVVAQAKQYEAAGARAISVLTDRQFFGGSLEDLRAVSEAVSIPVLRKDFIIDPSQIHEAKAHGADAVLLITTILTQEGLNALYQEATALGLDCLVETHTEEDAKKAIACGAPIIGVNARDLSTFDIDLNRIVELSAMISEDRIVVGESGISTSSDVEVLRGAGIESILVGTALMRSDDVGAKIRELII